MTELFVQRILLKLENEDYKEARALMDAISHEKDNNKSIRYARREMVKGNFEKAQLALDEYIFDFHHEQIRKQLMNGDEELEYISRFIRVSDTTDSKSQKIDEEKVLQHILSKKKQERWDDDEPNDSFCAACQQDPCMCSDPW
jgi:hypothetical protein